MSDQNVQQVILHEIRATRTQATSNGAELAAQRTDLRNLNREQRDQWEKINGVGTELAEHRVGHAGRWSAGQWAALGGIIAGVGTVLIWLSPIITQAGR